MILLILILLTILVSLNLNKISISLYLLLILSIFMMWQTDLGLPRRLINPDGKILTYYAQPPIQILVLVSTKNNVLYEIIPWSNQTAKILNDFKKQSNNNGYSLFLEHGHMIMKENPSNIKDGD
jgi:hypothetical protein